MKLHEYQAKAILSSYNVTVPRGDVATTPDAAGQIARSIGGRVVVKAQIHAGGRAKGGGVKVVDSPEEAANFASTLLGHKLVTPQTGPDGASVNQVLIEEAVEDVGQLYLGVLIEPSYNGPIIIASEAGGVEIEEVASASPEKIHREPIDVAIGFQPFQGRRLAYALGVSPKLVRPVSQLMSSIYDLFREKDFSLIEINPLVITKNQTLMALDAKLTLEDDALFRHPDLKELHDLEQEDPLESRANQYGIAYVKLGGNVGCMVNGAGLAMATMDVIKASGAEPANFLDVGGGASEEKVSQALSIILTDQQVQSILINVFGGILRCDIVAQGIVSAIKGRTTIPPIVVRMQGTNAKEGQDILTKSGLNFKLADSLAEAASAIAPREKQ